MTSLEEYIDSVTTEICLLGRGYCEEYNIDYSQVQEDMYNARSTMGAMYSQNINADKCARIIFTLYVHPVKL